MRENRSQMALRTTASAGCSCSLERYPEALVNFEQYVAHYQVTKKHLNGGYGLINKAECVAWVATV